MICKPLFVNPSLNTTSHVCRNGYQIAGNGRWVSMMFKTPKKKGGRRKKDYSREDDDDDDDAQKGATVEPETERDPDDPLLSTPMPRYNAMLAVLRSTLYMHVSTTLYSHKLELTL
jgi:hypothetical protein